MLTMWDSIQQIIRILLYAGAGALVTAGVIDQATGLALAGALLGVINGVWTIYWNKKAATIAGLEASTVPGTSVVAAGLEKAIADAKAGK